MASWVLRCPNCSETFVHSEIEDTLANFFSLAKPKFPEGGQTLACTHCGKESLFQQTDLTYQRESAKGAASS
jgi:DNA-directed RNA polymerase subunit RPC12/RpoP